MLSKNLLLCVVLLLLSNWTTLGQGEDKPNHSSIKNCTLEEVPTLNAYIERVSVDDFDPAFRLYYGSIMLDELRELQFDVEIVGEGAEQLPWNYYDTLYYKKCASGKNTEESVGDSLPIMLSITPMEEGQQYKARVVMAFPEGTCRANTGHDLFEEAKMIIVMTREKEEFRCGPEYWLDISNPLVSFERKGSTCQVVPKIDSWVYETNGTCNEVQEESSFNKSNDLRKMQVYPNPANHHLTITLPELGEKEAILEVFDLSGKMLVQQQLKDVQKYNLATASWLSGVYFIRLQTATHVFQKKVNVVH